VGARYGVVLTSSHRSLRRRWHTLFAKAVRSESYLARLVRRRKQGTRRGRLLIKWHTQDMKLFRSGRFARTAPLLLPIVILLCVGAFLSVFPTWLDVPDALTKAHSSHVSQGMNLESHPLEGSYLAVPLNEAEDVDKHPVDAEFLTALLPFALCFGASVGWLLSNGRGQGACRSLGIDRRWWFVSALEDSPFLGVFRL
jgi:hypothetical protein